MTYKCVLVAGGDLSVIMALLTMSGNVSRDSVSNSQTEKKERNLRRKREKQREMLRPPTLGVFTFFPPCLPLFSFFLFFTFFLWFSVSFQVLFFSF